MIRQDTHESSHTQTFDSLSSIDPIKTMSTCQANVMPLVTSHRKIDPLAEAYRLKEAAKKENRTEMLQNVAVKMS